MRTNISLKLAFGLCLAIAARADQAHPPAGPDAPPGARPTLAPGLDPFDLGMRVEAVRRALADPTTPGAREAITGLGHDSRYYLLVRGWLGAELELARSLRDVRARDVPEALAQRIAFLEQAIRAIDLE